MKNSKFKRPQHKKSTQCLLNFCIYNIYFSNKPFWRCLNIIFNPLVNKEIIKCDADTDIIIWRADKLIRLHFSPNSFKHWIWQPNSNKNKNKQNIQWQTIRTNNEIQVMVSEMSPLNQPTCCFMSLLHINPYKLLIFIMHPHFKRGPIL